MTAPIAAPGRSTRSSALPYVSGLAVAGVGVATGLLVHDRWDSVSSHVVAVAVGALAANLGLLPASTAPGLKLAAKKVLRIGIVLLGFRLSLGQMADLGPKALASVVLVVVSTFVGTQWLGRKLGLGPGLSLLVATGYSICGASAIAAAEPFADASEEEVAYSIGLVTICGSLAIVVLPALGSLLGLSSHDFGSWVGASVHDVGQVVAAASTRDTDAVTAAVVVKLTRVVMLAPLLAYVALRARRTVADPTSGQPEGQQEGQPAGRTGTATAIETARPPLLPLFVALFLLAVVVRTTGVLSTDQISTIKDLETIAIGMGLTGLGAQVRVAKLRHVGGRPLVLGLASWVLVAVVSLGAVAVIG
jgi:uncharacterized integral membrane protein (TIGR00698 family)